MECKGDGSLEVALQLGQGEIVGFQDKRVEVLPYARIKRRHTGEVVHRCRGNGDHIGVDAVLVPEE
ncbi:MAG: hypothetical protein KJZ84_24130 [Bryobacteraceae bacterium]|nr:hypothetical protein [Bryobacteraceae bacterium]